MIPKEIRKYFCHNYSELEDLESHWDNLDPLIQDIMFLYMNNSTALEFFLELNTYLKNKKFNDKLEGILND